jgi:signal transduction histidine kinase
MKTINKRYQGKEDLEKFIISNNIKDCENILLQIFTGDCDFVFIENIIEKIKSLIPHINIIGSTTSGEILEDKALENSTILSFSMFERTKIKTYYTEVGESSSQTAQKLISQFDTDNSVKVAISFADGLHVNGEEFIDTLSSYRDDLIIAGGLAGDNAQFKQTLTFTEQKILSNGAVIALLFNDELSVTTTASFGWENIGKTMTVTKANKNRVYEIDGIKAVDIYAKYLGEDIAKNLPKVGVEFPLIVKRKDLQIPRAIMGKHNDGSLVFAGNVNAGDKVTFGYGNIETILGYSNNIKNQFSKIDNESIFVYSCMARKALLQDSIGLELVPLSKITNVSGFFTYGEFYSNHINQKSELLNQTMTILGLSENNSLSDFNSFSPTEDKIIKQDKRKNSLTLKALSHLISQTSLELEDINLSLEKKIKEEVQKNREKDKAMLQQGKLAQMGEMIAMIAHQWRQPLSAVSATANDLIMKNMLDNYEKEYFNKKLKKITDLSQHLSKTIDDFRGFYKEDKEKIEILFSDILNSVLDIVSTSLENKNITIDTDLSFDQKIITYPNEIRQVILNLIKNAEDILIEKKIQHPTIEMKTYTDKQYLHFTVKDNGGGIPKDIINKIFDPYFSTKTKKDGTGLGLYMSKTIIEEHCNGELRVYNDEDGAVFEIKLLYNALQNRDN